jgi:hypothetical protein
MLTDDPMLVTPDFGDILEKAVGVHVDLDAHG